MRERFPFDEDRSMTRITITDEADDERWTLECAAGCRIRGTVDPEERLPLTLAAQFARGHAIETGHDVDCVEVAR